jgi:hypothetical protein
MPGFKELHYFADELTSEAPVVGVPASHDDYISLFTPATPDQLVGEASTTYIWSRTAAENIARVRSDARIIMILREPASFLRALHLEYVKIHVETERDLRRALALEEERRNGRQLPDVGFWTPVLLYSEHMRYMDQLRRYLDAFSTDQLLILIYDDFRKDNKAVLRAILRFLGVSDTVFLPTIEANQTVRLRNNWAEQMLQAVSEGHGRGSSMMKVAVEAVTTQRLRRVAQKAVREHIVYAKPQAPDHDLMLELRHRYKPEVVALSEYLKRDLVTLWGYHDIG